MDLRCEDCGAGHYTAATRPSGRFARDLVCSKCGGALVVAGERDQSLLDEDRVPPASDERTALSVLD